jgi:hypothetical protein
MNLSSASPMAEAFPPRRWESRDSETGMMEPSQYSFWDIRAVGALMLGGSRTAPTPPHPNALYLAEGWGEGSEVHASPIVV